MNRPVSFCRTYALLLCLASIWMPSSFTWAQDDGATLKIGSPAPNLDIDHWFSDNNGAFPHTTRLEKGTIYVIEFWATWCQPCVNQMPQIAALQQQHADAKVQFISISDEDRDTIEEFLKRRVSGNTDMGSYGELTQSYCLTCDPDKSVKKDYFRAAKQSGIPCTFIVGKTGLIEWIGNTVELDEPLGQIVAGDWDREQFVVAYRQEQDSLKRVTLARRRMAETMADYRTMLRENKSEEAVGLLNRMLADQDLASRHSEFKWMRVQVMVEFELADADVRLAEFRDENRYDAQRLNTIAWTVFLKTEKRDDVDPTLLEQAKITAEYAVRAAPESGHILDTLAHLIYVIDDDVDKALEVQRRATNHAGRQRGQLMPFLRELEAEQQKRARAKQ